jgi:hypothetical protein
MQAPSFQQPMTGFGSFPMPTASPIPPVGTGAGAPVDAHESEQARDEEKEEDEEDVLEGEPLVPDQKTPWAPQDGEEEFDLEYSRQIAARRVIGEEDE